MTSTDGVESGRLRYRFTDESDSPAAVDSSQDGGATWVSTRYVDVPLLGLVAAVSGSSVSLRIADLHQNIVSSIDRTAGSSSIDYFSSFDEFGVPEASASTQRFGWKGAAERPADSLAGTILMGARVYNPTTGYFLQVDPVRGGGTTTFGYPSDPVNVSDLTGRYFGIDYVEKQKWYSRPGDFWSASHHWWYHVGTKWLVHLTISARNKIADGNTAAIDAVFAAAGAAIGARGGWIAAAGVAAYMAYAAGSIKYTASRARKQGRPMRITVYMTRGIPGLPAAAFVHAWTD